MIIEHFSTKTVQYTHQTLVCNVRTRAGTGSNILTRDPTRPGGSWPGETTRMAWTSKWYKWITMSMYRPTSSVRQMVRRFNCINQTFTLVYMNSGAARGPYLTVALTAVMCSAGNVWIVLAC